MKRLILALIALIVSTSVAQATTTVDDHNHAQPIISKTAMKSASKADAKYLKVVPGEIYGFKNYPQELARIQEALVIIEKVINSETFKNEVIAFAGTNGQGYTADNGLSNKEVYDYFMQGKELLGGENTLGEMNFQIARYYKRWSKVIGYTNPGKHDWIMVNGKFYRNYSVSQIASNLTHEWLHLNGFYHASASDHESVPYAVGYIMEKLTLQYQANGFIH